MLAALLIGLLIGLLLGMVGSGGAVLALPALVFVVGLDVHAATTASLAIVGAGAVTAAVGQARRGSVCWTSAAWFAAAAAVGAIPGALLNQAVHGVVLLVVFAAVMLFAARAVWRRADAAEPVPVDCPKASPRMLIPAGLVVGLLTGLVGVGGGFLIVPALAIGLSFGMREAMGTSVAIIAIVSACGLAAHLATGNTLDLPIAGVMGGAAIAGALAGPPIAAHVPTRTLGRGLALLIVAVAIAIATAAIAGVVP